MWRTGICTPIARWQASPFRLWHRGAFVEWQLDKFFLHHLQVSVDRWQFGDDCVSQFVIARRSVHATWQTTTLCSREIAYIRGCMVANTQPLMYTWLKCVMTAHNPGVCTLQRHRYRSRLWQTVKSGFHYPSWRPVNSGSGNRALKSPVTVSDDVLSRSAFHYMYCKALITTIATRKIYDLRSVSVYTNHMIALVTTA